MTVSLANPVELTCPCCQGKAISLFPMQGSDENWFVKIACSQCGEQAFFQIESSQSLGFDAVDSQEWLVDSIPKIQQEWAEWVVLKKRYLEQPSLIRSQQSRKINLFLILTIFLGALFFLADQYHLLGVVLEDRKARQNVINQYIIRLAQLPCFSSEMQKQIASVPVHYTPESVYHHNKIQYGETGQYWGKLQIKIHRSNFWFFGWPKKSQLIETLIHEYQHRASPWLGHNARFYQRVQRDTQCALKFWHSSPFL